jgi:hypothetical protein
MGDRSDRRTLLVPSNLEAIPGYAKGPVLGLRALARLAPARGDLATRTNLSGTIGLAGTVRGMFGERSVRPAQSNQEWPVPVMKAALSS